MDMFVCSVHYSNEVHWKFRNGFDDRGMSYRKLESKMEGSGIYC